MSLPPATAAAFDRFVAARHDGTPESLLRELIDAAVAGRWLTLVDGDDEFMGYSIQYDLADLTGAG